MIKMHPAAVVAYWVDSPSSLSFLIKNGAAATMQRPTRTDIIDA